MGVDRPDRTYGLVGMRRVFLPKVLIFPPQEKQKTCHLKINGWFRCKFLLKNSPILGNIFFFRGCIHKHTQFASLKISKLVENCSPAQVTKLDTRPCDLCGVFRGMIYPCFYGIIRSHKKRIPEPEAFFEDFMVHEPKPYGSNHRN